MKRLSRRHFLHAAALGVVTPAMAAKFADQCLRSLRLSIAAYSYRKFLDLKNPTMTLEDFAARAADAGADAVELTAYYFPETSPDYLADLKRCCTRLGLDVSGTAIGNNFCTSDERKLEDELAKAMKWVEHSARLGGKTMRIFAGNVDKGDKEEKARTRCVEAIRRLCGHARKHGIIVALENHGGITASVEQLLQIVSSITDDSFGVNWDSGNFHSADPYADLQQLAPFAVNAQIKTEIRRAGGKPEPADLSKLIGILRAAEYRGYVVLEYEGGEDPKVAVPRYIAELRKITR